MPTRPSHMADAQARSRAARRYRQVGVDWVKGKEVEGAWVPDAASNRFASLQEAVEHDMSLTKQRRATWANLSKGRTALVQQHVTEGGEKTRAMATDWIAGYCDSVCRQRPSVQRRAATEAWPALLGGGGCHVLGLQVKCRRHRRRRRGRRRRRRPKVDGAPWWQKGEGPLKIP